MQNQELKNYIDTAKAKGLSDIQIKQNLLSSGWPVEMVESSLNPNFVPVPVFSPSANVSSPAAPAAPQATPESSHVGMGVVFEYVLLFITLAVSAVSLAGIAHYYVSELFVDQADLYGYTIVNSFGSYFLMSYAASIIVAFPIFFFIYIHLKKKLLLNPEIRNFKARKIFIYLALTWTFIALIIRLTRTVLDFLNGSAWIQESLLHMAVTLLISGSIFVYFILDLRK